MIEEELGSGQRGYNLGPVTSIGSIGRIGLPVGAGGAGGLISHAPLRN